MKPLIINVRGNSGSGKTHLTREFMSLIRSEPAKAWGARWANYDEVGDLNGKDWVVLGSYNNVCGGCDTIHTQSEIVQRVKTYAKQGFNIWLEGLLMSGMYGTVGKCSEQYGDRWVFAFLDTPLETCITRIKGRRRAAGNAKPLDETNTRVRHTTIERTQQRIEQMGRRVVVLDHTRALEQLLKIIKKEG